MEGETDAMSEASGVAKANEEEEKVNSQKERKRVV